MVNTITFAYTVLPVNSSSLPALGGTVNSIVSSYNGAEGNSMSVCPILVISFFSYQEQEYCGQFHLRVCCCDCSGRECSLLGHKVCRGSVPDVNAGLHLGVHLKRVASPITHSF